MESKFHNILKVNANRVKINYGQGEEIWDSLVAFIRKTMEEGEHGNVDTFKSVFINQLGTFYPNKKHIKKIIELDKFYKEENEKNKELDEVHENHESSIQENI